MWDFKKRNEPFCRSLEYRHVPPSLKYFSLILDDDLINRYISLNTTAITPMKADWKEYISQQQLYWIIGKGVNGIIRPDSL